MLHVADRNGCTAGLNLASLGGTLGYFIENTFTYPTLAEAY